MYILVEGAEGVLKVAYKQPILHCWKYIENHFDILDHSEPLKFVDVLQFLEVSFLVAQPKTLPSCPCLQYINITGILKTEG